MAEHLNFMAGISYDLTNPLAILRMAASSAFFGEPKYYLSSAKVSKKGRKSSRLTSEQVVHLRESLDALDPQEWRSMTPQAIIEQAIDDALAYNAQATLEYAAELRGEENIRLTPQVILVRAANHPAVKGTGLIGRYAPRIITRADEPAAGLTYQFSAFGKEAPIPNSLKRAWRKALEGFSDYQLAKYRMSRRSVKTVDVVNLVHAKSDAISRLTRNELTTKGKTWESIVSAEGSTEEAWNHAFDVMGHAALLKNLRNLINKGDVPLSVLTKKLLQGAPTGKQLPFRYYKAYTAVAELAPAELLQAIEQSLWMSMEHLPRFEGRTIALCDNSGSAQSATTSSLGSVRMSTIANLTGVLAALRSTRGSVGIFGDRLKVFDVAPDASVFSMVSKLEGGADTIGTGTENGIWLFFDQAIRQHDVYDRIMIMSDMQAGHGGLYGVDPRQYSEYLWGDSGKYIDVAKLIHTYRERVNPNVMVYLVQIAGYKDTLAPEFYRRTYTLSGWGEGIFRFMAEMERMCGIGTTLPSLETTL